MAGMAQGFEDVSHIFRRDNLPKARESIIEKRAEVKRELEAVKEAGKRDDYLAGQVAAYDAALEAMKQFI